MQRGAPELGAGVGKRAGHASERGDWADPALPTRDNWRKEVFDAARFAPALGRELLHPLDKLDALLCGAGTVWFVVSSGDAKQVAALSGVTRTFADARTELWRATLHACP